MYIFFVKNVQPEVKIVRKHLRLTIVASSSLVSSTGTVAVEVVPGL